MHSGGTSAPPAYSSPSGLHPTRLDDCNSTSVQRGLGLVSGLDTVDDLRCTIAMGDVIRDEVYYPVASPVNARHPTGIDGDVWVGHCLIHSMLA